MIFVRDKGQMCNNIFQYIQMYAWGLEHGRRTMSMRFAYKYRGFAICHTLFHNYPCYLLGKFLAWSGLIPVVDYGYNINPQPENDERIASSRHCMVEGWCVRHLDLVDKHIEAIRQLFAFDKSVAKNVERYTKGTELAVGIHIRRGDYRTFHNGQFYFEDDTFISCVNRLLQLLPSDKKVKVFVCGNDPKINRQHYRDSINAEVVFPDGSATEDLCLLSQCDYLIGPVSSFSLIATMYGKAKLYWMNKARGDVSDFTLGSFADFCTLSKCFDRLFIE